MSQKKRIRPLPRKRLPYGKFHYSIEYLNSRDHFNRRRISKGFDRRVMVLCDPDFYASLEKTLQNNVKGRYRLEKHNSMFLGNMVERIWLENYSDLLIIKMLHPEHIRRIYKVELFD